MGDAENIKTTTKTWTFKRGDVIYESVPYAYIVCNEYVNTFCHYCFDRSASLLQCVVCKFARYCKKQCQKYDWTRHHRSECITVSVSQRKVILYPRSETEDLCINALRLFGRVMRRYQYEKTTYRTGYAFLNCRLHLDVLPSYLAELKQDDSRKRDALELLQRSARKIMDSNLPALTDQEVDELIAKTLYYSKPICKENQSVVGSGFYIGSATIPHSCQPNAHYFFHGPLMVMHCMIDKLEVKGVEDVLISRIPLKADKAKRQRLLKRDQYIDCHCVKCSNPSVVALENWNSYTTADSKAQYDSDFANYNRLFKKHKYHHQRLLTLTDKFLKEHPQIQFPENVDYLCCLEVGLWCCLQLNLHRRGIEYGLKMLPGFAFYYGTGFPDYASLILKIEEMKMALNQPTEDSVANLEEAMSLLKVFNTDNGKNYDYVQTKNLWLELSTRK